MMNSLMIDIEGLSLTNDDRVLLASSWVGGVILFARNFQSVAQLQALTHEIKQLPRSVPLLIAVDQEGGRIQRFQQGFTALPALAELGQAYDKNPQQALSLTEKSGWLMAAELLACGVDFSFAPVLDIDYGLSVVIGDRSFHRQPQVVTTLARAYIKGMHQAGMVATGKHFPGHGAVRTDSHQALPVDERSIDMIVEQDMQPFAQLIRENLLAGIMPAHIIYSQADDKCAGFSRYWLQDILRQQLGFQGCIFSDDMTMAAASVEGSYLSRYDSAINAGCHMVLVCNNREGVQALVSQLNNRIADRNTQQQFADFYGKSSLDWPQLQQSPQWSDIRQLLCGVD